MTKRKGKSLAIAFLVMMFFVQALIFAHTDAHAGRRQLHKAVE